MSLSQLNLAAVFPGKALAMLELADEQGKVEIYRLYHELLCVGFTAHDPDHVAWSDPAGQVTWVTSVVLGALLYPFL